MTKYLETAVVKSQNIFPNKLLVPLNSTCAQNQAFWRHTIWDQIGSDTVLGEWEQQTFLCYSVHTGHISLSSTADLCTIPPADFTIAWQPNHIIALSTNHSLRRGGVNAHPACMTGSSIQ